MYITNFQNQLKSRNQKPVSPKLSTATIKRQRRINKANQKPKSEPTTQPTRKEVEVQTSFTANDISDLEQQNEDLLHNHFLERTRANENKKEANSYKTQALINGVRAHSNAMMANFNAQVALNNGMLANYNAQVAQGNLMAFGIASAIAVNLSNENQRLKQELAEYQQLLKQLLEEKSQERTL